MTTAQSMVLAGVLFASLALWLLLPGRGGARRRMLGAALGAAGLGLFESQFRWLGEADLDLLFGGLAAMTVASAVGAVTMRSPVYCAIWFGLMLLGTSGLFLLAGAQFLSVATIIVYAGAILVTFLFVLMLAQPDGAAYYDRVSWEGMLAAATGSVMIGILTMATSAAVQGTLSLEASDETARPLAALHTLDELEAGVLHERHVEQLGSRLFSQYLVGVEVAGVLLLVALVGAAAIVAQNKLAKDRENLLARTTGVAPAPGGGRRG